jgi:hypothetical protein
MRTPPPEGKEAGQHGLKKQGGMPGVMSDEALLESKEPVGEPE